MKIKNVCMVTDRVYYSYPERLNGKRLCEECEGERNE